MRTNSQRMAALMEGAQASGRKLLIPYLAAGDPEPGYSADIMRSLVAGGADLIELGMPFSDPEAEGIDIQKAFERALGAGTRMRDVLAELAAFREHDQATPVILMGYYNPLLKIGIESFTREASAAGADGLLIVNLPMEEGVELEAAATAAAMDVIYLCAPTTTEQRLSRISERASGFLYYVSLRGTTGASHLNIDEVRGRMQLVKSKVELPVVVGFGIKTPEVAAAVAEFADGVVVGAAIARIVAGHLDDPAAIAPAARDFMLTLRQAIDNRPAA